MAGVPIAAPPPGSRLEIRILGSPAITVEGRPLAVDTRKAVALLAYLVLRPGRTSRERLAALLWPESDDEHARSALRRTLSTLYRALGGEWLRIDRDAAEFVPGPEAWCDVEAFRAGVARRGDLAAIEVACSLYRDDLLAGFSLRDSPEFEDWLQPEIESLRATLSAALADLAGGLMEAGALERARAAGQRWLAVDPLSEAAHRLVMRAHSRLGDRTAALRQYRDCIRILDAELGVAPVEETAALAFAIRSGVGEGIAPPPASVEAVQRGSPTTPARPFVGRETELRRLREVHDAASQSGRLALVEGEVGIGKTRLIDEFGEAARRGGAVVLAARCYEGEAGLAYGPVTDLLRGIGDTPAGLAPEAAAEAARLLAPAAPRPENDGAARRRFFEGVVATLETAVVGRLAGVVVIDDGQWMDAASIELLGYLVRRLRRARLLLVIALRPEDSEARLQIQDLAAAAERDGTGTRITLGRLDEGTVHIWARGALGDQAVEATVVRLAHESEGLPLLVAEYLAGLASQRDPGGEWVIPRSARDLFLQRVRGAGEIARQLLATASVVGRSFAFDLVREASGRSDEETLGGLEHLLARGLIAERLAGDAAGPAWDFMHGRLRDVVYDDMTATRRRLLHRRVAEVLARREGAVAAAQVAQHYQHAGLNAEAAAAFVAAGERARALFANQEALGHFASALALGAPGASGLHVAMGELHLLAGAFEPALAAFETAAALAEPAEVPPIDHTIGRVYHRLGRWEEAIACYRSALEAPADGIALRSRGVVLADWSLSALRASNLAEAGRLVEEALVAAGTEGDGHALARARIAAGILARRTGEVADAARHLERALATAEETGDFALQAAALNNLALALSDGGDLAGARVLGDRAVALCLAQGDRHRAAAVHSNLADFHHAGGDRQASLRHLKAAAAIFAEIGTVGGERQPEVWKLVEW